MEGKNIYFTEHDVYFTKLMFILKNINLELKAALKTKYIFYRILLYSNFGIGMVYFGSYGHDDLHYLLGEDKL